MTRRDYVRLARVIADAVAATETEAEARAMLALTYAILPVLSSENGRFDPARFLAAINARVLEHVQAAQAGATVSGRQ